MHTANRFHASRVEMSIRMGVAVAASVLLATTGSARAAILVANQNFDSLTTSNISGQDQFTLTNGGAVGSATVVDTPAIVYGGTGKSLNYTDLSTSSAPQLAYVGNSTVAGDLHWVAEAIPGGSGTNTTTIGAFFTFLNGTTVGINRVGFGDDGTFDIRTGNTDRATTAASALYTYVTNRFYQFDVTFDANAGTRGQATVTVTDLTTGIAAPSITDDYLSGYTKGNPFTQFQIRGVSTDTGTMIVDNLTSTPEPGMLGGLAIGGLLAGRRRVATR